MARRVPIGIRPDLWTAERRERYLIRVDVPQPLSVDVRVWPTGEPSKGVAVAISVLLDGAANEAVGIWLPRSIEVDHEVELLGYDVADEVMMSGLSNCSYSLPDKVWLRQVWAHRLNRFHLFERADLASEFKTITEERVPEHAPFFVFGLYRIGAS